MPKRRYRPKIKIKGVRQAGVDLPDLLPGREYELEEADVRDLVEEGYLEPLSGGEQEVDTNDDTLSKDFPSYYQLTHGKNAFKTYTELENASDEDILAKEGIGEASLAKIKKALKDRKK